MSRLGQVRELWVFPVKSMSGSRVDSAVVEAGGLVGDRSWAVVDASSGETVTAKHEPRLREAVARVVDGRLEVDVPGAGEGLDEASASEALTRWLGRSLRLDHREGSGFVDVAPVHLVSTASLADASHAEECDACDVTAPRANLVLDLAHDTGAEPDWVGRSVRAGDVTLAVVRRPTHCLGVYADVSVEGTVTVGDTVTSA
jgi:uncharacterized protein YcbX